MGGPHVFLRKKGQMPQPVSCFPESHTKLLGFPVPVHFLGAEPTISPRCGDLYLEKGDELIFLSCSKIPIEIWSLPENADMEMWTQALSKEDPDQPFWLGRLKFD
jgi:hypothetical protein